MRIFKNLWFERFARKEQISDNLLRKVIMQADQGLIDADLGHGVIKQRIPRRGQGKSGGYRAIILFRHGDKALFVYGFAKSDQDNITANEKKEFRKLADKFLAMSEQQLTAAVESGKWKEIINYDQELS